MHSANCCSAQMCKMHPRIYKRVRSSVHPSVRMMGIYFKSRCVRPTRVASDRLALRRTNSRCVGPTRAALDQIALRRTNSYCVGPTRVAWNRFALRRTDLRCVEPTRDWTEMRCVGLNCAVLDQLVLCRTDSRFFRSTRAFLDRLALFWTYFLFLTNSRCVGPTHAESD